MRELLGRCMTRSAVWALDFKTRQYLKGSLWFLPLLGGIAGAVLGLLEPVLTRGITVPTALEYSASTASLAAGRDRGGDGCPDRLRRHRQRPRRPDGDEQLLGPLHAPLVPGQGPARPAGDAGRDVHLLVHAAGGGRGELRPARRRHRDRRPDGRGPVPLPVLPRPLRPPAAAGRGRSARRDGRQARVRVRRPGGEQAGRARDRARAAGDRRASRRSSCARAAPARSRRSTSPDSRPLRAGAPLHARAQPRRRGLRPGRSEP